MIKIEYEYIKEKDKIVNVSYNIKTDGKNWKDILKREFCNIINHCGDDLLIIRIWDV